MRVSLTLLSLIAAPNSILAPPAADPAKPWEARLEALRPSEPLAYFELAEEVADAAAAAEPTQRDLARHLFALAGALDPDHLGRSACLALADMEENANSKRRLLALAALLGSPMDAQAVSIGIATPARTADATTSASAALAITEALSYYRKGRGPQALNALKKPGAMELLQQHDRMLPGGANRFIEDCKVYKGQAKPTLSADDVARQLRFEAAILAGGERTWASELLLTGGKPLIEVDPARLEESLGVDVGKPLYRNGRWVGK